MELDELKKREINILNKVVDFCNEHGLQYYLTGGTLIGAVRHKGFIPWDDDIDLNMRRKDYEFFFTHFNHGRNDNLVAISIETNKKYYLANGKVYDNTTVLIEDVNFPLEIGVNIDIFPLDDLPSDNKKRNALIKRAILYRDMLMIKQIKISAKRSLLKNIVLWIGQMLLRPIKVEKLLKKISLIAQTYNGKADCGYIAALSTLVWGEKEIFKVEDFATTTELEFEGRMYKVHCGYDNTLRQVYGDYMKLPPIEKRVSHHSHHIIKKTEENLV